MIETTLHATTVAIGAAGVVIIGPSGAGKSALALELINRGAVLVSDDLTRMSKSPETGLVAHAPDQMAGVIEARFVGLIRTPFQAAARVQLVVDLSRDEQDRLPQAHEIVILGEAIPCLLRVDGPHFAASIMALIKGGRQA
ncbi:MAG: HPr kinase/phosphorylase [Maritimibacter sp.]